MMKRSTVFLVLLLSHLTPARAASLPLVWDQNCCTNLAGYRIYYGSAPRTYTNSIWEGNVTNATINNLVAGNTYYFAATAQDTTGVESLFSDELQYQIPAALPTNCVLTLSNLTQTYDGTPKPVTVLSSPSGAPVAVTYNGSSAPPVAVGSYCVTATVSSSNGCASATNTLVILKAVASLAWGPLTQNFDGTPKTVLATTVPAGPAVTMTYNGGPTPPSDIGSYQVIASVNDPNYCGVATNTLVIKKGVAMLSLTNLVQVYDGKAKVVSVISQPSGLSTILTYGGTTTPPTNAGSYAIVATVNDSVYSGSITNTLTVTKASAQLSLSSLAQTYDGHPKAARVSTTPSGLATTLTYSGKPATPSAAGSYSVVATISDANHFGSTTNTLVISKAAAGVAILNCFQFYNGSPKTALITTTPAGLATSVYYDGQTNAPTASGVHLVIASIADNNYYGAATNNLLVLQESVVVTLAGLAQAYDGTPKTVSVTTQPASIPVLVTYNGSNTAPTEVGSYAVVASVADTNCVGQATNVLVITNATGPGPQFRAAQPGASPATATRLLLSWTPTTNPVTVWESTDLVAWNVLKNDISQTNALLVLPQPGARFFRAVTGPAEATQELRLSIQPARERSND